MINLGSLIVGMMGFLFSNYSYGYNCLVGASAAAKLSESCIASAVAYEPNFSLFSNSAEKARWILLPENTQMNTSNPDYWEFPEGTVLWKEFAFNGRKIETRQLEKISNATGPLAWRASVYIGMKIKPMQISAPMVKLGRSGRFTSGNFTKTTIRSPVLARAFPAIKAPKIWLLVFHFCNYLEIKNQGFG